MFKKIQKYLLINHPLLWNLKIVPVSVFLILTNIIFFILGFLNGGIDFTNSSSNYDYENADGIICFFSILVSIIALIIWLIYYVKNNPFKSYYPKNNFSLFKEWALIFTICILLSLSITSYYFGKDVKGRSYYTETEAKKRCDILRIGSFFINGSLSTNYKNYSAVTVTEGSTEAVAQIAGETASAASIDSIEEARTHIYYKKKKYNINSIVGNDLNSYSFFDYESDSITKNKIKDWLVSDDKISMRNAMKEYLKIANEHQLKSSIDENQWLNLIYDYPNFEEYKLIAGKESQFIDETEFSNTDKFGYNANMKSQTIDLESQYFKKAGKEHYIYNKYFLPEEQLNYSYAKISESYVKPFIRFDTFLMPLYFALSLSILIFSFRVTSIRSIIITLISLGILGIIIGFLSAVFHSEYIFLISVTVLNFTAFIYFMYVLSRRKQKKLSDIFLNVLFLSLIPIGMIAYNLLLEFSKWRVEYDYSNDFQKQFPKIYFFQENGFYLMYLNIVFVILALLFYSFQIKKWKGLPEN